MRILVTGGTGVIGAGAIPELIKAGHEVRLLSRHASGDARRYPEGVTPFDADVRDGESLRGAAEGCGAAVHIAGIVEETEELTFEDVNVGGTRRVLEEAARGRVGRFVFVSSLGADSGESGYHRSKLRAEEAVRSSSMDWVILRPGNVYGPGDEVISMLLKLTRAAPAVPVVGWGEQRFQPIWFEDVGKAVAKAVNEKGLEGRILEIAGREITTTREVLRMLGEITDRPAAAIPTPAVLAAAVGKAAERSSLVEKLFEKAGLSLPIGTSKLQMLLEENLVAEGSENALTGVLGIEPTPLGEGLRRLANELPELLPEEGVGGMERKVYRARIAGPKMDAKALAKAVREKITEVMPIEFNAEPGAVERADEGATLTGAIPGRGHFQVRVAEAGEKEITMLTVAGHPLAGMVKIRAADGEGGEVRAEIETLSRAANVLDWLAMRTIGGVMQDANWRGALANIVRISGGEARGDFEVSSEKLSEGELEVANLGAASLAEKMARAGG